MFVAKLWGKLALAYSEIRYAEYVLPTCRASERWSHEMNAALAEGEVQRFRELIEAAYTC